MYEVIYKFKDKKDNDFIYKVGALYPRKDGKTYPKRIAELSSENNLIGKVLIKKIEKQVVTEPKTL